MLRYLWKAFNARPFSMPIPPLWFAAIASGLVGYFIAPPLALIGLGATAMFTGILASSRRFRTTVDASLFQAPVEDDKTLLPYHIEKIDPLLNEAYVYRRDPANRSTLGDYGNFNAPRTYGVSMNYSF